MSTLLWNLFKRCVVLFLILIVFTFSGFPAEITVSVTVADTIPPAAVTNLTATTGTYPGEVNLTWNYTGDNGDTGDITNGWYAIQHSTDSLISWSTTYAQVVLSTSVSAGSLTTYQLSNLLPGVTYYLRIWTADEEINWSGISNGATSWAQTDQIAPATITNLSASCATDGTGRVTLNWTAPKEDGETGGAVSAYDVRYATWDFTSNWDSGTQWTIGVPTGATPGTPRNLTMLSLANDTTYYFIVKSTDDAGNVSEVSNLASTYAQHIVISEVQIAGATADDEFVELYNPLSVSVNLNNWRLTRKYGTGPTETNLVSAFSSTCTIPAYGYFLVTPAEYTGSVPRDYHSANGIAANNTVLLYSDAGTILIDKVGFGSAKDYETQTTTSPSANQSVERRAKGGLSPLPGLPGEFLGNAYDTNNNNADFVVRTTPDPQNSSSSPEPDTIPPAAVTDLTASSEISGTIKLTWSAPGDDSSAGSLPVGSMFKVQHSTFTEVLWSTANAQVTISTSNVTPGSLSTYLLSNLTTGGTYYICLWTADEVLNWSEISNGATVYIEILAVSVDVTTLDFGTVAPDTNFNITTTSINITNTGSVSSDFVLSCSNSANWTLVSSTPTNNTEFRLLGNFNTAQPQASDYEVNIDTITNTAQTASSMRYVGDQTGNNVPPGEIRNLWLCFSAPRSIPTNPTRTTQSFTVSITVQKTP